MAQELELQRERLRLREREVELKEGLPFLHGWKWYPWARDFFESVNKLNFLCAANQISKSSTQIRKCIDWATNQEKWPRLWRHRPVQFWYLYPAKDVADIEFKTKWQQFLPQGRFKEDPVYGWKEIIKNKCIWGIQFNSGVLLVFKTYEQDVSNLQTGTCDAIFCDEELPMDLYSELMQRISASDGYFHMVFTATLGQQFWKDVIETKGDGEKLPEAFKQQVSMYDCQLYEDGSHSHWSDEKIKQAIGRCKSHAEVLRRIFGKFVKDTGLKYPGFDMTKNMMPARPIPKDWHVYAAVDLGGGGEGGAKGHLSAITFVACSPDYTRGEIFEGWRGDGIDTTPADVLAKFQELRGARVMTGQFYDWASKDFFTIATRANEPFSPAEKSHAIGEPMLNTLFKTGMLMIHDTPELYKLAQELASLDINTAKNKAKDDFIDSARYAVAKIPWDWSVAPGLAQIAVPKKELSEAETLAEALAAQIKARRGEFDDGDGYAAEEARLENEFAEWNELAGG